MGMKWAIDMDGVITSNPQVFSFLTYHLCKNENDNKVFIITWRDGSNEQRKKETIEELKRFNITYDELIMAPRHFANMRIAGFWKISQMRKHEIDIWFDDELKAYRRDYGFNLGKLLPDTNKIFI